MRSKADASVAWFLYLLECSDGSVYTGIATDV
ncbi:MAG: GIY-YIG nuclease family protein, partial [Paraburkholderia graminis]